MLRLLWPKNDLRTLITLLAVASIVITLANSLYATWRVQRDLLINNTLESNRVYATKLAATTEIFFQLAQSQLAYSARMLSDGLDNDSALQAEVDRVREQTTSFNSVVVVDVQGRVRSISPKSLMLEGIHLTSTTSRQALGQRKPLISQPAISAANNLMVFVSSPIWSKNGTYRGFIGGTLYLKKKSILNALLGEQFYRDGSSLYVVDKKNKVLYHQNAQLIGKTIAPLISEKVKQLHRSGYQQIHLKGGESMLAGYAVVPTSDWMVVALKPTQTTLQPLTRLLFEVLEHSVPFALLTLIAAWILARLIALPLWQLARKASQMDKPGVSKEIGNIRSWYFEAAQIKRALLAGIGLLQDKIGRLKFEVQTDPLTQLLNRRGLSAVLEYFLTTRQPFAILALDIDHFKRVNDTFGHDVGDAVIIRVARELEQSSRQSDVVCRNGGEEFLMILPGTDNDMALMIAERVRQRINQQYIEPLGLISVSIGVSLWQPDHQSMEEVFKAADDALYQAKKSGRNCVIRAAEQ